MLNFCKPIILSFIFLLCSVPVQAATWRVEKDGSGDFTVIQRAVDAAADGDTILIGPGRYVDFELHDSGYWIEEIIVVISYKNNLTIIGAGVEETIVGLNSYYSPYGEDPQLIMGANAENIRLENLKVENCEFGIVWNSGSLSVDNCNVSNCYRGIYSFSPDGTLIENSEFLQQNGWSIVTNGDCQDITIIDSIFHGQAQCIGFNSTLDAFVTNCNFEDAGGGVGYSMGSTGQVTGCTMSNVRNPISITTGSQAHLLDNYLDATDLFSLYITSSSYVSGTGNVFSGGSTELGTLYFSSGSTSGLTGNHFVKSDGPIVSLGDYHYALIEIDLSNNYWGTTDIETIEEWIHDVNDDSSIHGVVNFLPLADGPVPTDKTTLDGLKAMYRDVSR